MKILDRRQFLKISSQGFAAVALGSTALPLMFQSNDAAAQPTFLPLTQTLDITMEEVMWEMVDGTDVYSWAFNDSVNGFRIPGSTLFAIQGDDITINVTNNLPASGNHGFRIPGMVNSGIIPPGQTVQLNFRARKPGTYMYLDPYHAPKNRVMGLHGVLVVLPRKGNTPYIQPTPAVQQLFDDLGSLDWAPGLGSAHFPGHPWDPDRTWIWVFQTVDSVKHAMVMNNPGLGRNRFLDGYLPDYFLISGKGGYFLSHDHDIGPHGNIGEPALIRCVNAGLNNASPHIHGNHVYMLAENNALEQTNLPLPLAKNGHVHSNVIWVDTWVMRPGDRKDVLLPFVTPPDIPLNTPIDFANAALSEAERTARLGSGVLNDPIGQFGVNPAATPWPSLEEPFPMVYPMHDHDEIAQTAAHGNYPQGAVLHWEIRAPIDGVLPVDTHGTGRFQSVDVVLGNDGVIFVDTALFRTAINKVVVKGKYSGLAGSTVEVFAGADFDPLNSLGTTTIVNDGTYKFRQTPLLDMSLFSEVGVRAQANGAQRIARLRIA